MQNEFTHTFNRMLSVSGKSLTEVAYIGGADRSYAMRLVRGEKVNPSLEQLLRLWIGLIFDRNIIKADPTMLEGYAELVAAAGISGAATKLAEK